LDLKDIKKDECLITRDIRHPQMKFNRFIYYIPFGIIKQTCFNKEETLQKSIDESH